MKIIFLLNSPYPYYTGGRETWVYNICNRIVNLYDVEVITEKCIYPNLNDGVFTGIDERVKIIPAPNLYDCKWLRPILRSYINYFRTWVDTWSMYRTLKKRIKSNGNVIVISLDTVFLAAVGNKIKILYPNILHICSARGKHSEITASYYPLFSKQISRCEYRNLRIADRIWANGNDTQAWLQKKGFFSSVVINGVDLQKIDKMNPNDLPNYFLEVLPKIVTIGTLLDLKGYPQLIQAIAYLHKTYGIKIHMFGFGKGDPKRYISLAEKIGIAKFVHFMGEVRDAVAYAKGADVIACLGTSEGAGLSMAALESLASQRPVIAWNNACYQQIIKHEKNGILINEGDVQALGEGIKRLLENKESGKRYASMARENVTRFDWSNVVENIVYEINNLEKEKLKF